jgi:predicted polyphosphate/ATP-dependent NAD kinase
MLKSETDLHFITCSGAMGADILRDAGGQDFEILYTFSGESSARDTKQAAAGSSGRVSTFCSFCGGDGTARDIFESSLAGMCRSSVFLRESRCTLRSLPSIRQSLQNWSLHLTITTSGIRKFLMLMRNAYRSGLLKTRIFGIARTPALAGKTQVAKQVYEEQDEERAKQEIARFMQEVMLPDTLYIIGAGTTTEAISAPSGSTENPSWR